MSTELEKNNKTKRTPAIIIWTPFHFLNADDLHTEETSAFSKPILINIKCFKDLRNLPACCLWAISGLWKLLSPDDKWCPNVAEHHSSLTAIDVKYFVPETLRIKFLPNQPELLSQNTCWLHRKASAYYVTARVNPEQRTQTCSNTSNLCTSRNWPLAFMLNSWWSVGVERAVLLHHPSTHYHTRRKVIQSVLECSQETKHLA